MNLDGDVLVLIKRLIKRVFCVFGRNDLLLFVTRLLTIKLLFVTIFLTPLN